MQVQASNDHVLVSTISSVKNDYENYFWKSLFFANIFTYILKVISSKHLQMLIWMHTNQSLSYE